MSSKKKIRVKVKKKKKKINFKRIFIFLIILFLIGGSLYYIKDMPIRNIYIVGNNIVSDKEIIESANLDNYPSFLMIRKNNIIKGVLKNNYIKKVTVEKKLPFKLYIYIKEKKPVASYNDKILLEDGLLLDNTYNLTSMPSIKSDISGMEKDIASKFAIINDDVLIKISEVMFDPNEVDKERFALYMNDGNLVYITLSKIKKINKYNNIYSEMNGKKGIIYLDSGDYIELK